MLCNTVNYTTGEKIKHNVYCTRLLRPNQLTKLCWVHHTDVKDIRRAGHVVGSRRYARTCARAVVLSTRASRRPLAHTRALAHTHTHTHTHTHSHVHRATDKWRQTTGPDNRWPQREARQNRRDRTRPNSTGNYSTIPSCK